MMTIQPLRQQCANHKDVMPLMAGVIRMLIDAGVIPDTIVRVVNVFVSIITKVVNVITAIITIAVNVIGSVKKNLSCYCEYNKQCCTHFNVRERCKRYRTHIK